MDDHYVSQTYLKGFTNADGLLLPYYKGSPTPGGKATLPKSVCFESDGDSNKCFQDPRILDSYLPQFENPWKENVDHLRAHAIDYLAKYQMSGYIAFLRACTPTSKRIGQELIRAVLRPTVLETAQRVLNDHPPSDPATVDMIQDAIHRKEIDVDIDREFPHAIGISNLLKSTARLFNGEWHVLINNTTVPFVTSDNPAVVYYHGGKYELATLYIPVAPDIAVMIRADLEDRVIQFPIAEGSFSERDQFAVPKARYIDIFNELIIKAAEKRIFSNARHTWIEDKVLEFGKWRMETVATEIMENGGTLIITRQEPVQIMDA